MSRQPSQPYHPGPHNGGTPLHRRPHGYTPTGGSPTQATPSPDFRGGATNAATSASPSHRRGTGSSSLSPQAAYAASPGVVGHAGSPPSGGNRWTAHHDAATAREAMRAQRQSPLSRSPPSTGARGGAWNAPGVQPQSARHASRGTDRASAQPTAGAHHRYYVDAHQQHNANQHGYPPGSRRSSSTGRTPMSSGARDMQQQQRYQRRSFSSDGRAAPHHHQQQQHHAHFADGGVAGGPIPSATPRPTRTLQPSSTRAVEERDESGQLVREYFCGRLLGKGGFAKVYLFTDAQTGDEYAAKVIDKTKLKDRSKLEKLLVEIRIHEQLAHPHVVRIFRHFEDETFMYILLEKCPNQTLLELSRAQVSLSIPEVQFIMLQLLCGVEYLHRANVIHRDLKLANVLVDEDLNLKIGDFGLAAAISHQDEVKMTMCGTPNYIAPEILASGGHSGRSPRGARGTGKGYNYRADIWSLGVILYTLFVGAPPFETDDLKTTYDLIQRGRYTMPPAVPYAAQSLIRRILQVDPERRPTLVEIRADAFFAGCRLDSLPPRTLIDYFARLANVVPSQLEARIEARRRARVPQVHDPLPTAEQDAPAQDPSSPASAATAGASRRLFAPPLDGDALEEEARPRGPLAAAPTHLVGSGADARVMQSDLARRVADLSPLAGTSPVGGAGSGKPYFPHDEAGAAGAGTPPPHAAAPTPASGRRVTGDDLLEPLLDTLIAAQGSAHAGSPTVGPSAGHQQQQAPVPPPRRSAPASGFSFVAELGIFHRYGLAFRTGSGATGAYFNDRSRLCFDEQPPSRAVYYERAAQGGGVPDPRAFILDEHEAQPVRGVDAKKATLARFFQEYFVTRRGGVVNHLAGGGRAVRPADPAVPIEESVLWEELREAVNGPPVLCCLPGATAGLARAPIGTSPSLHAHVHDLVSAPSANATGTSPVCIMRSSVVGLPAAATGGGRALPLSLRGSQVTSALLKLAPGSAVLQRAVNTVPTLIAFAKLSTGETQVSFFATEYALAQNFTQQDREKLAARAGPDAEVLLPFPPDRPFPPYVVAVATVLFSSDNSVFTLLTGTENNRGVSSHPAAFAASYGVQESFEYLSKVTAEATASVAAAALRKRVDADASPQQQSGSTEVLDMSDSAPQQQGESELATSLAAALWLQRVAGAAEVAASATGATSPGTLRLAKDA